MLCAFYIGDHAGDTLLVRWACKVTRLLQKGPLGIVTHCEAIKAQLDDLDLKSIRALREGDLTRIKALEDQAGALRAQITA